jgi:hypothetical protein
MNLFSRLRRQSNPAAPDRGDITLMFRNRAQLEVLARLLHARSECPIDVAIYGVADGAEAVSLLVATDPAQTPTRLRIAGYDINDDYLSHAATFTYPSGHFPASESPDRHPAYFESVGGDWRVRPEWQAHISIGRGNVLTPEAPPSGGGYQLVMCQNLLVSLSADDCATAINALGALIEPGGLLAVGGGRLDVVPAAVLAAGFEPILDSVEAIHEGWTIQRSFYANARRPFWALEPFDAGHPDGAARYCTIFRKLTGL